MILNLVFEGAELSRCSVYMNWVGDDGKKASSWQALMPIRTCLQASDTQASCPSNLVENITAQPIRCLGPTVTTLDTQSLLDGGFPALQKAFDEYIPTNTSTWANPSSFTFENLGVGSLLM